MLEKNLLSSTASSKKKQKTTAEGLLRHEGFVITTEYVPLNTILQRKYKIIPRKKNFHFEMESTLMAALFDVLSSI